MLLKLNFIWTYLCTQIIALVNLGKSCFQRIGWLDQKRNLMMETYQSIMNISGSQIRFIGSQKLFEHPCLIFSNHRSGADFFVDGYLTSGNAAYLGLAKIRYYLPGSMVLGHFHRHLILFTNRSLRREELYGRAIEMLKTRSIILYPEGSRNLLNQSLPLKIGFIKLAYQHQIPVQIMITGQKEDLFNEKTWSAQRGVTCLCSLSDVLKPNGCASLEHWIELIQQTWDQHLKNIYDSAPHANTYIDRLKLDQSI